MARSSVALDHDLVLDLHQIAIDLGRREERSVTLGEVIRRLIETWRHASQG